MKNGDDDDEDMKETEKRDGEREERRKKERNRGRDREGGTEKETPNTDAFARTTLKITVGCLCQGPSRRFQGAFKALAGLAPTKTCPTVRLFGRCFKTGRTRPKKKRVHVSCSSQAVLEMAAFGAHARQASADEPTGARLFSGFWVRKNFSSENTTRVRSKGFKCRLPRTESTPTRCSTSRQNFNLAKRFSVVNLGAQTGLKHRMAWRSSCNAHHSVERDMSSELCRRNTFQRLPRRRTQDRENDDNRDNDREGGEERRGERGEERRQEEMKMREGREKEQMMKIVCFKTQKTP